jgi:hypothetical protein
MNEGWDYWLLAPVICGGSSGVLGILWGIPLYLSKGDRAVFTAVIAPIVLFAFVGAWSGYAYHFGKGPANLRSSEEVLAESIFNCVFAQGFFAVPAGFVFGMVTLAFRARGSERDRLKG